MDLEQKRASNVAIKLSDKSCKKIASKTIRWMRGFDTQLLEIDGLKNSWDDVCYQIQKEEFFYWSHYYDMVASNILSLLAEQEDYEVNSIWLQTNDVDYQLSELWSDGQMVRWSDGQMVRWSDGMIIDNQYKTIYLSCYIHDIARYITGEYIYKQAEDWRNDRLRQFLGYF